jgi:protein ImuB
VAPGAEAGFLAPLPIDLLAPEDALAEQLTRFGVHRVCDLLDLPRRGLGARLGSGVLRLIALARGEEHEAPLAAPPRARLVEAADLDFPIDRLEPLGFALQALLSRLLVRLEARHLACGELGVALELEGGARDGRCVGVAAPTLELRVLVRLIRQSLETRPPRAPVIGAAIESEGRPLRRDQLDLFRPAGPAAAELDFALAELASLCGDDRVGSPVVADDHHPAAFGMTAYPPPPGGRTRRATEPPEGEPALADGHRPALRLLRPPVPARVRLFQGRPEAVRSAVVSGRVVRLAGPWRTTGAWWSSESHFAYDSFDVQTSDGSVARLRFDHLRRTWHVDAVYD